MSSSSRQISKSSHLHLHFAEPTSRATCPALPIDDHFPCDEYLNLLRVQVSRSNLRLLHSQTCLRLPNNPLAVPSRHDGCSRTRSDPFRLGVGADIETAEAIPGAVGPVDPICHVQMDWHGRPVATILRAHPVRARLVHRSVHYQVLFQVSGASPTDWILVAYALGIYLLNLFLAFLQPKFDPSNEAIDNEMEDGAAGSLPTKQDEEFRPFIRRLPEFKFWHSATRVIFIGFICSWFEIFNVPVFWPVLVMYWFILFFLTSKSSASCWPGYCANKDQCASKSNT